MNRTATILEHALAFLAIALWIAFLFARGTGNGC